MRNFTTEKDFNRVVRIGDLIYFIYYPPYSFKEAYEESKLKNN